MDAGALAGAIREQTALPLTEAEADALARSLETAADDEALLSNTLAAVRLVLARLEPPPDTRHESHDPATDGRLLGAGPDPD